jgi:hypothetical protein
MVWAVVDRRRKSLMEVRALLQRKSRWQRMVVWSVVAGKWIGWRSRGGT